MDYPFLREFPRRMKVVGMYAVLLDNSGQKAIWRTLGFTEYHEQVNIIFTILMYIMEQSLKEELCLIEHITDFFSSMDQQVYHRGLTREQCRELVSFVLHTVLGNDGRQMHFYGYDFENGALKDISITYVETRTVYDEHNVRRTSYSLSDNGYSLLLGTLEVESNMQITIQEIIFNEQLRKRNFDKALDNVKRMFELMRIEKHKNEEAVARIRQNILNFSVDEYRERIETTFQTIRDTRMRLTGYKKQVKKLVEQIEARQIDLQHMDAADRKQISLLNEITHYLDRAIDRHMDLMESYNEYHAICAAEMENYLQITRVDRFSFSKDLFSRILDDATLLGRVHGFLSPLFNRDPPRIFNLNRVFVPQRRRERTRSEPEEERIDFDEAAWREEMRRKQKVRQNRYTDCLTFLLECTRPDLSIRLSDIQHLVVADYDKQVRLIPSVSIFKDVMIELIRTRVLDVQQMKLARADAVRTDAEDTTLLSESMPVGEIFLEIVEGSLTWRDVTRFTIQKIDSAHDVVFENVMDGDSLRKIICTDILFTLEL